MSKFRSRNTIVLAALLAFALPAMALLPGTSDEAAVPSLAPVIKQVSPAVVNIAIRGTVELQRRLPFPDDPFFRRFFGVPDDPIRRRFQSAGSGVIVDAENGYILTNYHVIAHADEITVTLQDNRSFRAEVVGSDEKTDIAVLRTDQRDLTALPLGNSDQAEVGDYVIAIGNPFGLQHTVTLGIISALGRTGINREGYEDFIQTDASINPGNSGGALVTLRGELIGVNSAILSRSGGNIGIGFAIPVNMARAVMSQIIEHGEVRRGVLGVHIFDVSPDVAEAYGLSAEQRGAFVSQIEPDSAAEAAGIRPGDVIVAVNGKPIEGSSQLRNAIGLLPVGEEVRIDILREGRRRTIEARIGEELAAEDLSAAEIHRGLQGAELQDGERGVVVASVEAESPAAQYGLRPDDVITHINRRRIATVSELRAVADGASSLILNVLRGNAMVVLLIR